MNGENLSLTSTATVGYRISPRWQATAALLAGMTPLLERRIEGMAKIVYFADFLSQAVAK